MLKRSFDVLASLLGLLLLLPVLIAVAIWIKLDSKGPVFFRQIRVGRHGKAFRIHKFRTMTVNTEKQGKLTIGTDSRVTRSGEFLRKAKIDELPQLIDVLFGAMSLVGPRPEVPEFMDLYPADIRNKILSVRPGITDKASIEMIDENKVLGQYDDPHKAYVDIIMPMKAKFYCDYVDTKSFWGDIKIILMTVRKIIYR